MSNIWLEWSEKQQIILHQELTRLGISKVEDVTSLPKIELESLAKEYEARRKCYKYGPEYEAYEYLRLSCWNSLPALDGGSNG